MEELIRLLTGWKSSARKASDAMNTAKDVKRGKKSHAAKVQAQRKRVAERTKARKKPIPSPTGKERKKKIPSPTGKERKKPKKAWYRKNLYDLFR